MFEFLRQYFYLICFCNVYRIIEHIIKKARRKKVVYYDRKNKTSLEEMGKCSNIVEF